MSTVDARVADSVDLVADLLNEPIRRFPIEPVSRWLFDALEITVVTMHELDVSGAVRLTTSGRPGLTYAGYSLSEATDLMTEAANSSLMSEHPLARWNACSGSQRPQSLSRALAIIGPTPRTDEALEMLRRVDVDDQLAIPLVERGPIDQVLTVCRPDSEPFHDEQMEIATRLQPLFVALRRQAEAIGCLLPQVEPLDLGLTGRELAVLQLLATGRTSTAIGAALGCSGRTVQKHLEHAYRKLGVTDRVSAVGVMREAGLIAGRAVATATRNP